MKTSSIPGKTAILLFALWMVGLVTSYTCGGYIHLFFLIAILVIVFDLTKDRRVS